MCEGYFSAGARVLVGPSMVVAVGWWRPAEERGSAERFRPVALGVPPTARWMKGDRTGVRHS